MAHQDACETNINSTDNRSSRPLILKGSWDIFEASDHKGQKFRPYFSIYQDLRRPLRPHRSTCTQPTTYHYGLSDDDLNKMLAKGAVNVYTRDQMYRKNMFNGSNVL